MSLELIVGITVGILIVFIALVIGYGFRKREIGSKAALKEIAYSAVIIGIIIILICVGYLVFSPKYDKNYELVLFLFMTGVIWAQFFSWLWRRSQAGSVLLDLGRSRQSLWSLIGGAGFILLGFLSLVDKPNESNLEGILKVFFYFSLGLNILFRGSRRLDVREHGFSCVERFIKWDRIKSFSWEGEKALTLALRLYRRFLSFSIQNIAVPPHLKDKIEELLTTHLHDH